LVIAKMFLRRLPAVFPPFTRAILEFYISLSDLFGNRNVLRAAAIHMPVPALLGVKVILPGLARDNLPLAGYPKPL